MTHSAQAAFAWGRQMPSMTEEDTTETISAVRHRSRSMRYGFVSLKVFLLMISYITEAFLGKPFSSLST